MTFLLFLALTLALANVLVNEGLLDPLRQALDRRVLQHTHGEAPAPLRLLRKLISCAPCSSFWTGALVSLLVVSPCRHLVDLPDPSLAALAASILDGLVAHAAALLFFRTLDRLSR